MEMMQTAGINTLNSPDASPDDYKQIPNHKFN